MKHKILILSPTVTEIEPFLPHAAAQSGITVSVTGVGLYKTAFRTLQCLHRYNPDVVILAGIAGAYPGSGLVPGESVLVGSETCPDAGAFTGGKFLPKFSERYECPHLPDNSRFRIVQSHSVHAAATPYITPEAGIENMEGAAFFFACLEEKVKFLELRTVSNLVGDDYTRWNIPLATASLAGALKELIREIEA